MNKEAYKRALLESHKAQRALMPQALAATEKINLALKDVEGLTIPLLNPFAEGLRQAALSAAKGRLKAALEDSDKVGRAVADAKLKPIEAAEVEPASELARQARALLLHDNLWAQEELGQISELIEAANIVIALEFAALDA